MKFTHWVFLPYEEPKHFSIYPLPSRYWFGLPIGLGVKNACIFLIVPISIDEPIENRGNKENQGTGDGSAGKFYCCNVIVVSGVCKVCYVCTDEEGEVPERRVSFWCMLLLRFVFGVGGCRGGGGV